MLTTKTKTKITLGIVAIICLLTVVTITTNQIVGVEPIERDPNDPGNSPGPGKIFSIEENGFAFIEDITLSGYFTYSVI